MKLGKFVIIFSMFAFFSGLSQAQIGWENQTSGTSNDLWSVKFVNDNTGYCVGEGGVIRKTSNKGVTWTAQSSGTTDTLFCISFANDTGYVCGSNGTIRKTVNGGINWLPVTSGTSNTIKSIYFISGSYGYYAGYSGIIGKTTNGGTTWTAQNSGTTQNLWSIHFEHRNLGWAVGFGGVIRKTTNGGTNWVAQGSFSGGTELLHVNFLDANTGIAGVGEPPSIDFIFTTNGGANWTVKDFGTVHSQRCVDFIDQNNWMAVGDEGDVFRTTSGGQNWNFHSASIPNWLFSTSFINPQEGWAVGTGGIILHTTSGGLVGLQTISSTVPEKFALYSNYPNPFNPSTKIRFDLPKNDFVSLKVYNINGQVVSSVVEKNLSAGQYEIDFNGALLSTGTYFYRIETSSFTETKKMVLVK